jgi:catechol 2,3-dioxygenase
MLFPANKRDISMEIGAHLDTLEITASNADALAAFYAITFVLDTSREGEVVVCKGPGRHLRLRQGADGQGGQLKRVSYRFPDAAKFEAQRAALQTRDVKLIENEPDHFTAVDPEGREIGFLGPDESVEAKDSSKMSARLQHFAVRTPKPAALVEFYSKQLGFVVSDRVLDAENDLSACFLRTDAEHHTMAIFRSPETRFDHFSCEAPDWNVLRDWADHMAKSGFNLAWGIGRHGPGNDTFLMVKDIDGNMGEISCDLEVCQPDRPAGVWPHRPETLNQWGVAIMRS